MCTNLRANILSQPVRYYRRLWTTLGTIMLLEWRHLRMSPWSEPLFIFQLWNRLSRFQRSLLYILFVALSLFVVYNSGLLQPKMSPAGLPPASSSHQGQEINPGYPDGQRLRGEDQVRRVIKKTGAKEPHSFNNRVSFDPCMMICIRMYSVRIWILD